MIVDGIENPLSSAALRYRLPERALAAGPGPAATRPFGLRGAVAREIPAPRIVRYCPDRQVAVDADGRPLAETMGKQWATKGSSDGDEGPEEDWGWEE